MFPRFRKARPEAPASPSSRATERPVRRESPPRAAWRKFRRATDRYRLFTDVIGALLIVAIVVGTLAGATGGVWPPIVVVESGSMMHSIQDTDYGRIGSIDVGDIVFVRGVRSADDVVTWAEGGDLHYGRPGNVLAYVANGDRANISVIHRAIAWIDVTTDARGAVQYRLQWTNGETRTWGPNGIYFPPLGFDENWGFSPRNGYRPAYSGFITKGDNSFSNPATDQAMGISRIVDPTWVVGTVYGEVPWLGLAKLSLQSGQTNPAVPGWERVGNAFAPMELWTMFFVTLAIIILIPLALDTWRAWRRIRIEQETTRRIEEENRKRAEARRAAQQAAASGRRVTSFASVVSTRPARVNEPR